jgi:hypothetical protein
MAPKWWRRENITQSGGVKAGQAARNLRLRKPWVKKRKSEKVQEWKPVDKQRRGVHPLCFTSRVRKYMKNR